MLSYPHERSHSIILFTVLVTLHGIITSRTHTFGYEPISQCIKKKPYHHDNIIYDHDTLSGCHILSQQHNQIDPCMEINIFFLVANMPTRGIFKSLTISNTAYGATIPSLVDS